MRHSLPTFGPSLIKNKHQTFVWLTVIAFLLSSVFTMLTDWLDLIFRLLISVNVFYYLYQGASHQKHLLVFLLHNYVLFNVFVALQLVPLYLLFPSVPWALVSLVVSMIGLFILGSSIHRAPPAD